MYTQKYVYIYMHVCAHIHIIYDIISGVGPEVADLGFSRSRTGVNLILFIFIFIFAMKW